jgi:hypothetical protein
MMLHGRLLLLLLMGYCCCVVLMVYSVPLQQSAATG